MELFDEENEMNLIKFKLRENGEIVFKTIPFNNYFYLYIEDYHDFEFMLRQYVLKSEIVEYDGQEYAKCYYKNNTHRYFVKKKLEDENVTTFEMDIDSVKRFNIVNGKIPLCQEGLEKVFIDIETDDRKPLEKEFNGSVIASSAITGIAFKDLSGGVIHFIRNKGGDVDELKAFKQAVANKRFLEKDAKKNKVMIDMNKGIIAKYDDLFTQKLFEYERELLFETLNYLKNYDVTLSWNGWRFDVPFLKGRCEVHQFSFGSTWTADIDYMEIYKKNKFGSVKSYGLNAVSIREFKEEVEEGKEVENIEEVTKIDWKEKTGLKKYWEMYLCAPDVFKEYNIQDVNLMYMLEKKLRYMELQNVITEICHCPLMDTIHNSKSFDYAMLNENHLRGIISPSKPSKEEQERRKDVHISGGYTYVYEAGVHEELECYDYKSFYPTTVVTFNISPETFVTEMIPDLHGVLFDKESEYLQLAIDSASKYLGTDGKLKQKKYNEFLELNRPEGVSTLKDIMFKFVKHYDPVGPAKYAKENNLVFTPADINYDTRGWCIHPHRFYTREEGVFPMLSKKFLVERDTKKYELTQLERYTPEWWATHMYQNGLKTLGNSGYGAFGFRSFRFFMKEIGDAITTSCRFIMKKSIVFAEEQKYVAVFGDTDSSYLKNRGSTLSLKELDIAFYEYYDKFVKQFNTNCSIEHKSPITKEKETKNHFIVFEHEKTLAKVIIVAKKRYYYKEIDNEGKAYYATMGGAYKKTDTMPLAAKLQKELCREILDDTYDKTTWIKMLSELKKVTFDFKLDEEQIVMTKGISKKPKDYGGATIDSKTGMPKIKKDGTVQQKPIPCHIKIAAKMIEDGHDIEIGDKIDYVIVESKPRLAGISMAEFHDNPRYDADYYWRMIIAPLLEILKVTDKEEVYESYWSCWNFTDRQKKRLNAEIDIIDENEEVIEVTE